MTGPDPELNRMMADLVAEHVKRQHPGEPCLEGFDGKCIAGAPPEVLAADEVARDYARQQLAAVAAALAPDDCSRPWTLDDVRAWVRRTANLPGDREVTGALPPFPRNWARTGGPYGNTLLGLSVDTWDLDTEEGTTTA